MIKVPLIQQKTDYSCAEACIQSLFNFHGINYKNFKFSSQVDGTAPRTIEHHLRVYGYNVLAGNFDWLAVKYFLRRGIPVITCYDGHYVILCGTEKRSIIIMDPMHFDYQKISIKTFKNIWEDWDSIGMHYKQWCIIGH